MSCIFESNLRNNPMHNRHILREGFGDRPFMPEDPTDGKPEEMPEAEEYSEMYDDPIEAEGDDGEQAMHAPGERWFRFVCKNADGWTYDFDVNAMDKEDAIEKAKEKMRHGDEIVKIHDNGEYRAFDAEPYADFYPPIFTRGKKPSEIGESCVMGSNLLGHGGYGKAILREMVDDGEPDVPNLEPDDEPDTPVADEDADSTEQTVGERISQQFDGSPSMINQGIEFMMERGYKIDDPSYTVDEDVWDEMANTVIGFNDEFETDPEAELVAASDYYDEHPYEVEGATTDEVPTAESYELHSLLTVEGQPKYEEPEVKKEPKPKPPRLTAKRNRRLRSKSRNIQIWDSKKKCFDPRYINTRFTRMSDAKDAIAKIGESCCCCGCDKPKAKGKAKGKPVNKKFAKLKEAAMAELGGDMGQTYGNHMDEFGRGDVIEAMPPDGGDNVVYVLKKERDWYGEYVIKNVETKEQEYSTDDWEDAVTTLYDMARRKQLKVVKNRSPEGRVRGYKAIRTPYTGMSTRRYDNEGKYIGDYE